MPEFYRVKNLGIDAEDYFPGFGAYGTGFDSSALGVGDTPRAALVDCLEMMSHSDTVPRGLADFIEKRELNGFDFPGCDSIYDVWREEMMEAERERLADDTLGPDGESAGPEWEAVLEKRADDAVDYAEGVGIDCPLHYYVGILYNPTPAQPMEPPKEKRAHYAAADSALELIQFLKDEKLKKERGE